MENRLAAVMEIQVRNAVEIESNAADIRDLLASIRKLREGQNE